MLKDKASLSLTAKFNFTFKYLPDNKIDYFLLTNGNNTVTNAPSKK
jgi:hypothetical protein